MNLTDSLLGAICLVFLLVLLGTLTQERAAPLELRPPAHGRSRFRGRGLRPGA